MTEATAQPPRDAPESAARAAGAPSPGDAAPGDAAPGEREPGDAAAGEPAPGDAAPGHPPSEEPGSVLTYTAGFALALLLTAASFIVAQTHLLWSPGLGMGLAVLAMAQMGVHLVFFLHMSSGPDNTNNVLALAFGVLIVTLVVGGSLWIMANLNANMMPTPVMMEMSR